MKKLSVKLVRSYTSKAGNKVFVYSVSGTPEMVAEYKKVQGENFREDDDGTPLFFTTRCIGNTGSLIITKNNRIVPDMSQFDQADSLAKQYGGNLGQELARMSAEALMGKVRSNPVVQQQPEPEPKGNTPLDNL